MTATGVDRASSYAVGYAQLGWPVFPLWPIRNGRCACPDPRCENAGKHPVTRGWQKTIGSTAAAESAWHGDFATRGIGLACGDRAGVWALDVDRNHGGLAALGRLEADYGRLPESWRVGTGGGGLHVYFAWPQDGPPITNSDQGLPEGINVRGRGGFTVLPPSPHVSGDRYEWITSPRAGSLAPAPGWLLELVRQPQRSLATGGADEPELIPAGKRYSALVRFCGLLRSVGLCEQAVVDCGHAFLRHQCVQDPPMDLRHAERSMRDIARRYPPVVNR